MRSWSPSCRRRTATLSTFRHRPARLAPASRVQCPGASPHSCLCICICRRTGKPVCQHPFGQLARPPACRAPARTARCSVASSPCSRKRLAGPVVIGAVGDHDLDLIVRRAGARGWTTGCAPPRRIRAPSGPSPCARAGPRRTRPARRRFPATPRGRHRKGARAGSGSVSAPVVRHRSRTRGARRTRRPARRWRRCPATGHHGRNTRYRTTRSATGSRSGARTRSASPRHRPRPGWNGRSRTRAAARRARRWTRACSRRANWPGAARCPSGAAGPAWPRCCPDTWHHRLQRLARLRPRDAARPGNTRPSASHPGSCRCPGYCCEQLLEGLQGHVVVLHGVVGLAQPVVGVGRRASFADSAG